MLTTNCLNGFGEAILVMGFMMALILMAAALICAVIALYWTINFISMMAGLTYTVLKHPLTVKEGHSKVKAVVMLSARSALEGRLDIRFRSVPYRFIYDNAFNWKLIKVNTDD